MKKLNIVIPDAKTISCGDVSFDCFKEFGEVTEYQLSGERFLAERIKNADIILCNKTPMSSTAYICFYIGSVFQSGGV